jgi:hypothetical protein
MRSSSSKAEACAVAVWRTVVRTALNAVVGIFFGLLHEKQARNFFKDLKFDVVVETRSSSSKAEACAAAVWRTVVKTAWNAVVVGIFQFFFVKEARTSSRASFSSNSMLQKPRLETTRLDEEHDQCCAVRRSSMRLFDEQSSNLFGSIDAARDPLENPTEQRLSQILGGEKRLGR